MHLTPEDMRGIGIQISRLEISKNKQSKNSLINFFNKTEKEQTCEKTSASDDQRDSTHGEEFKLASSKAPSNAELAKNASDKEINISQSDSAQFSESTHTAVPPDFRAEPSTFAVKAKNKKLTNFKATNDNVAKVKDSSGKSSKKPIQRQTSQENFFRQVKPSSGRSSKYEVPRMQDIDMSVLIELPTDIRNEILDEYKRNKEQSRAATADAANTAKSANECNNESSNTQNCSQIDPDVLSTLMESDLHPDVQRDVQMYCDMKKEASRTKATKSDSPNESAEELQRAGTSSKADDDRKCENAKSNVNNNCTDKIARAPQRDTILHAREQPSEEDNVDGKARFASRQINRVEISGNNAVVDKADTFILQNLSILHNNENVDKHQEMLINLVNHLFTLPLQQVPL